MKVLLDEDVPVPLIKLLQHVLRGHAVDHFMRSDGRASQTSTSIRTLAPAATMR
jgi:hypothetical protein